VLGAVCYMTSDKLSQLSEDLRVELDKLDVMGGLYKKKIGSYSKLSLARQRQ